MIDWYSQTELATILLDKTYFLGVDEEFLLVEMKNISQKYTGRIL